MLKQTPSQTVGPFFHYGLVFGGENILVNDRTAGEFIQIKGCVFDGDGQPVPDALIEIWQADSQGIFNHPADPHHDKADREFRGFGRSDTVNGGQFYFKTIKPGRVASDDQHYQAPYINVHVFSRGLLTHAHTRLYFSDERANETDPVLNSIGDPERRKTLIAQRQESNDLTTYRFDIIFQGAHETVFFKP
jgi:protocatechuate 3,4-dioxygenase alpha subunit